MRNRLISLLLCAAMLITLMPAYRAAESVDSYPVLVSNFNSEAVRNDPDYYVVYRVKSLDARVDAVTTYHWNGGKGATPGTISIYRYNEDTGKKGALVGTWKATGRSGNTYWDIYPHVILEKGHRYLVEDSGWDTWSCNETSDYAGFVEIRGENLPDKGFRDVPESAYYRDAVDWAVEKGITYGTSDTAFSPGEPCTRAQVVTFLWRTAGKPEPVGHGTPFADVPASAYYDKAVRWAVEKGITKGTSDANFSPNAICTRGQIVTFLYRFKHSPAVSGSVNPFRDVADSAYYYKPVMWAVRRKVTSGVAPDRFAPGDPCTRGQIVTFLYRDQVLYPDTPEDGGEILTGEKKQATVNGVTVDAGGIDFDETGDLALTVSPGASGKSEEGSYQEYNIDLGGHREFDAPVAVTFPVNFTADQVVLVEHYDAATGRWEMVYSEEDPDAQTVTGLFTSFSPERVTVMDKGKAREFIGAAHPGKPDGTLYIRNTAIAGLKTADVPSMQKMAEKFQANPESFVQNLRVSQETQTLEALGEAYSAAGLIWTVLGPALEGAAATLPEASRSPFVQCLVDNQSALGGAMTNLSLAMIALQAGADVLSDGTVHSQKAAVNLYKNLLTNAGTFYSMATGYSSFGFTLAFMGVGIFAWELDSMVDYAKGVQDENLRKVFDAYYTSVRPVEEGHWFRVFEKAYWDNWGKGGNAAEQAIDAVKTELTAHSYRFWQDVAKGDTQNIIFAASDAGVRNLFLNADTQKQAELSESLRCQLWQELSRHDLKIINRFIQEQTTRQLNAQLNTLVEPFNRKMTVTMACGPDDSGFAPYGGHTVVFGVGNQPVADSAWRLTLPQGGEYETVEDSFEMTVYGWLSAGSPDTLLVYENESDIAAGKQPIAAFPFAAKTKGDYSTHVVLGNDDGVYDTHVEVAGEDPNSLYLTLTGGTITSESGVDQKVQEPEPYEGDGEYHNPFEEDVEIHYETTQYTFTKTLRGRKTAGTPIHVDLSSTRGWPSVTAIYDAERRQVYNGSTAGQCKADIPIPLGTKKVELICSVYWQNITPDFKGSEYTIEIHVIYDVQ